MKRITVTLTEDQISKVIGALESYFYDQVALSNSDDNYERNHNAFLERIIRKLKIARAKA